MPLYRVYFHWFDEKKDKVRRENVRIEARNVEHAKQLVWKETKTSKGQRVPIDRVVRLKR